MDGNETSSRETGWCHWCGNHIVNGAKEAGAPKGVIDWMSDGDYGCNAHPITDDEGVGPHETDDDIRRIVAAYHSDWGWMPRRIRALASAERDAVEGWDQSDIAVVREAHLLAMGKVAGLEIAADMVEKGLTR